MVSGVTPGVKSIVYDACADVMRSPHPPHEPPPVYSPRRRHNSPCGRVRCLSRLRMASVAAAWSMGILLARAGRQIVGRMPHPAPSAWNREGGGAAEKPVISPPAPNPPLFLPCP